MPRREYALQDSGPDRAQRYTPVQYGEKADKIVLDQRKQYTEEKLKNLVWWFNNIFGWKAEFKPELLK